jgi:hypothetical protein
LPKVRAGGEKLTIAAVTVRVVEADIEPEYAEMVAVPAPAVLANPIVLAVLLITAIPAVDEVHVTVEVMSWVLLSANVPVAVNCCVAPRMAVGVCGFIAIETSATGFATNVADPPTEPELVLIIVVPAPRALANPAVPAVSLMEATVAAVELQCPLCVRSCVVPSENVPIAVNCCVVPLAIVAVGGIMAIETSVAVVTVSMVEPFNDPDVAEIVAVPCPTLVANPEALIVTVAGVSEDQLAVFVSSSILPSVYVPVAVNCWIVPGASEGVDGVMAIETSDAAVTVNAVDPLTEPEVAEMVAPPCTTLTANPALLIVAVAGAFDDQVAVLVRFWVLASVNVPVAVNCCVAPDGSVGIAGVTTIETKTAGVTVTVVEPLIVPEVAVIVVLPTATPLAVP